MDGRERRWSGGGWWSREGGGKGDGGGDGWWTRGRRAEAMAWTGVVTEQGRGGAGSHAIDVMGAEVATGGTLRGRRAEWMHGSGGGEQSRVATHAGRSPRRQSRR